MQPTLTEPVMATVIRALIPPRPVVWFSLPDGELPGNARRNSAVQAVYNRLYRLYGASLIFGARDAVAAPSEYIYGALLNLFAPLIRPFQHVHLSA